MQARAKAYVLIEAEAGHIGSVLSALRGLVGVSTADPVTGPYDVVAILDTPDQRDIGRLVMTEIHGIPGIKRTITCHII